MKNYVESPISIEDDFGIQYITKGKQYETSEGRSELSFRIKDDSGYEIYCLYNGCSHLNGNRWIKVKNK